MSGVRRRQFDWILGGIVVAAAALRLLNLNYSHFQGDEIKALYPAGADFPGYLFLQSKGPGQFLITLSVRLLTGGYEEWVTRLPFAVASIAGVVVVYRLVSEHWGSGAARIAAALVATNGLLVAFGRIVQYQSFVMLFLALTALWLLRAVTSSSRAALAMGFASYALGLFMHWDAIIFGPTVLAFCVAWVLGSDGVRRSPWPLLMIAGAAALAVALFYVPFLTSDHFATEVPTLRDRVSSGQGLDTFGRTWQLLGLYLPPGLLPLLMAGTAAGLVIALRRRRIADVIVAVWFVTDFCFYMFLGGDPRSHVYTYFTPAIILVAFAVQTGLSAAASSSMARLGTTVVWLVVAASFGSAYYMFVDHEPEHPWHRKYMLSYELPNLVDRRVEGVFGFPYRRGLDELGARFRSKQLIGAYATNERGAMTAYYFGQPPAPFADAALYVHVLVPLSLDSELPEELATSFERLESISSGGTETIVVYKRASGR